ncbi:hypothetical protein [Acetivibrio straminisolvens]|uniref:Endo-1,4-beta-xylanase n=1 Tax=Acetivibrio straminisolvens JCM 21531 TaxID=1294263 RepID=W4VBN9_9FIRM|nr:hypothetical protein [Acetivibrio straminisolvens]GAE90601.1 endo-1,4-beta-xylanase [Acetivibrio straminisolvens JCM 21531]
MSSNSTVTPTVGLTVTPSTKSAFTKLEAEEYDDLSSSTIQVIGTADGGEGIGYIEYGDYPVFKNVASEVGQSPLRHLMRQG